MSNFVKNRAQRINVRGRGDVLRAASLFRGHVARRAEDRPGLRQAAIALGALRETEVGDERLVPGSVSRILAGFKSRCRMPR